MAQRWYVARTKPNSESAAARTLEREGLEFFLPRVETPRPSVRRVTIPLFPGYIFVRYDLDETDGARVRGLPGIIGLLHFDGLVPAVPDAVVDELAARVNRTNETGGLWTRFREGDTVRVVTAKMDTLGRVLEEPKSPEARVRVLLEFMGDLVQAKVPWNSLQRAKALEEFGKPRRTRRTRGGGRWVRGFGPEAALNLASA